MTKKQPYRELGKTYIDTLNVERSANRHIQRLKALGFTVTIQPVEKPMPL